MTFPGSKKGEWLELRVPESERYTPEEWVRKHTATPEKLLQKLLKNGGIMQKGDRLLIKLFPRESDRYPAQWSNLDVLFEDDFCLVAGKPAGMPVHPSREGQSGTLANAVAAYYEATGQSCKIRHIHRLDENTTGPVLYAKNEFAHIILDEQMREKKIERIYAAVVKGILSEPAGRIEAPIGRDRHNAKRRRVTPGGDFAATRYETMAATASASLVRLRLETGRTHQIRVHMSHLGHPLYGDTLYGGPRSRIGRQALHGEKLLFRHPWHGETVSVIVPYPDDFAALMKELGLSP